MKKKDQFPEWIVDIVSKNQASINKQSLEYFEKVKDLYPHFVNAYIDIPCDIELGVLKCHNPSKISDYYQKKNPFEFIVFNVFETFHFIYIYQVRELSKLMEDCLESGKYFGVAILNRSIFELVCTTYYTFRRVESKFIECINILKKIVKTKSIVESETLTKQYFEKLIDIYIALDRGNTASSIDWQDHMQKFGLVKLEQRETSKIHIGTVIEDMQKQSKMPLSKIYGLMSEFVHPNYGSKMLVIKTANKHDELMDKLTVGENNNNEEAALFYIDQCSEGLYVTLTLAMSLVDRSSKLLTSLSQIIENDNKTLQ